MKKLHSAAFYALVAPIITLSAGSALAQQSGAQQERESTTPAAERSSQQSTQQSSQQRTQSTTQSGQQSTQGAQGAQGSQNMQRSAQPGTTAATSSRTANQQSGSSSYLSSAPSNGLHAGQIIGSEVRTSNDENVGPVNDMIIDQNGQVVAIVVGVGGFLGVGEKDVAIGWDAVSRNTTGDMDGLRVNVTRDALRDAPEFRSEDR